MATITGLLGGKPGMISGAAGALAVVVTDLTIDDGVLDYLTVEERLNVLYMTMFVCGIAQILFAWFRLANLVKLIPQTGLIGFMDGLAISTSGRKIWNTILQASILTHFLFDSHLHGTVASLPKV
jgi:SulP family sulfate permease